MTRKNSDTAAGLPEEAEENNEIAVREVVFEKASSPAGEGVTGAEVIASGFHSSIGLMQKVTRSQWRRVSELVRALGLSALAERGMSEMSYGELRKLLSMKQ